MAKLLWDQVGDREYETGVDRGVLYLNDGTTVPWNGLTAIEETSDKESASFYMDGVKYMERITPGDFSANLKAFTYPEEFERVNGSRRVVPGMIFHNQPSDTFGLSYRTRVGNDVTGSDFGYKIHIIYNASAVPDSKAYGTINDTPAPVEFGWTLKAVPEFQSGFRPTSHITLDSTELLPPALAAVEDLLYGTSSTVPVLPSLSVLVNTIVQNAAIYITDNGDGTWTATGPDARIEMINSTTYQLDDVSTHILDANSYEISTS